MEDGEQRAVRVARRQAQAGRRQDEVPSPDWENDLPDPALTLVMQKLSSEGFHSYFLVCSRWRDVGRRAQLRFKPWDSIVYGGGLLLREIRQFPNLTWVALSGSNLSDSVLQALPGLCPKLTRLSLDQESLGDPDSEEDSEELPPVTGGLTPAGLATALEGLTGLEHLDFTSQSIPLPATVSALQNLQGLVLQEACGPLPDTLGALSKLTKLEVSATQRRGVQPITALPASIWHLTGLEHLTLQLEIGANVLPPEASNLTSLRDLSLKSNLVIWPPSMSQSLPRLSNLEFLGLSFSKLRGLPASLHGLRKFKRMSVNGYSLRAMPPSFLSCGDPGDTVGLEELFLSCFKPELSGGLSCLQSTLKGLIIDVHDHYLPYELGSLSRLEALVLCECRVLEYLPESLCDLKALERLWMFRCKCLKALPRALSSCPKLKELKVKRCAALDTLPEDLGNVPKLRTLELIAVLSLTQLPQSLMNAKELQTLTLEDCPQLMPSPGLLDLPRLDDASREALKEGMRRQMQG